MSAFNAVLQANALHIMTDGLAYDNDGTPALIDLRKAHIIGDLKAVVVNTGPALLSEFMAKVFEDTDMTFDELRADMPAVVENTFHRYADEFCEGDAFANVMLAGCHESTGKLAMYAMDCTTFGETHALIVGSRPPSVDHQFFSVSEHPEFNFMPPMSAAQIKEANFTKTFISPFDQWVPDIDLLHALEIQRRSPFVGGKFKVGGRAELTTITPAGVTQRIVHNWTEDEVGKTIAPKPIDWTAWRATRAIDNSNIDFDGLSRLQRERMLKKAKKGKLRA